MRFFIKLLSRLSLESLYRIVARPFFDWGYYILRWRRTLAANNLAHSFPELSPEARAAILKQSYRNLADLAAEIIWSFGASPEELRKRVHVVNPEVVLERTRAGQSVLLMTAHYCNWEWQVLAGNTWLDEPMFPIYKPQRVAAMDKFLREARGRFGGTPIPHTKLTRELLRRRSETHVYAMVADQTPPHNDPQYWTTFLHQETAFFVGADAIARILQAAVVFVEMQRVRRGYYTMKVSVIAEPPYDRGAGTVVVERYVRALENEIRSNPANWLWIHRKWKYPKPPTPDASRITMPPG